MNVQQWTSARDGSGGDVSECSPSLESHGASTCLALRQAEFARALLDPKCPVPPGLIGPDEKLSTRRFNVYRNNVVVGLTTTLRDAFPAVARIVGDDFFVAMARIYVLGSPPVTPIMLDYGAGFPDFIGAFEPARCLPYLAAIARVERAWLEAYHSADAQSLDPIVFSHMAPGELPNLRLALHPSLRLVRSQYPSLTIWQMNIEGGVPDPVDLDAIGDDILVIRPDAEVELRILPPGGLKFVQALARGLSVVEALEAVLATTNDFDLSVTLRGLIEAQAFIGLEVGTDPLALETAGRI